ncbi:hypothetical protein FACS1894204_06530 [Synergistales bacterium]|nr:hypothetical protein FACS1894204_06530 [Synergistales bacterium]
MPIMEEAIGAYRGITATDEFKEIERLRTLARHNEASALGHARREATAKANAKWQAVVADKEAALANKDAEWGSIVAANKAALMDKDAEIARLRAQLGRD